MKTVQLHSWTISAFAVLFALQAPVCAVACLSAANDSSPRVAAPQQPVDSAPCHGSETDSQPGDPPAYPNDGDCNCETLEQAVWAKAETAAPPLLSVPVQVAHASGCSLQPHRLVLTLPGEQQLPPRDLLLLKSTLLV